MTQNPSLLELSERTESLSDRKTAELLNSKLVEICRRAIEQASEAPPAIKDWRDMETARKVLAAATGTDVQKPLLNLIFPPSLDGQSSEAPSYIRLSDITAAKPQGSPAPAAPDQLADLPAVALHAIEAHARQLEATGTPGGGRTASA